MGGTQSTEQNQYGFHVLKVKENSPAFKAGIEQFFDYIVSINQIPLNNGDSQLLLTTLEEYEGKPLPLGVYSSKEQSFREVTLIPTKDWNPSNVNEKSYIGCSVRFCSFERAGENVWHILDISPNSPAEMAGLIPYTDYIIGSPNMTLRQEDDLYALVEEYLGKPLRLYLYNTEWDSCRECIIVPNHEWGGSGSLGCDVGYGLLHRIPRIQRKGDQSDESHVERDQMNRVSYSDVIFSAPDANENDTILEESNHTHLPESPMANNEESEHGPLKEEVVSREVEEAAGEEAKKVESSSDNKKEVAGKEAKKEVVSTETRNEVASTEAKKEEAVNNIEKEVSSKEVHTNDTEKEVPTKKELPTEREVPINDARTDVPRDKSPTTATNNGPGNGRTKSNRKRNKNKKD
ncbi:GRASP55/65 PDZ-like domain-containing protein [Pilobolus umbonatus]|nr:GRASP55/65 PDZ-like domain-containing protein [Pilobolus umbonatus]